MNVKRSQAERTEQTRRLLLDVGRALFAERGYAETATEELVRQAGVTRGALYYHFRDKQDLFRAVVEDLEAGNTARLIELIAGIADPWERLRAGSQAFLDLCLDPAVRRILLQDAPSVLGWEAWRELDAHYGLGLLKAGLQTLIDAGVIAPQPVDPLAHVILGALTEGGLAIARADDIPATRAAVGETIDRMLGGLRS